MNNKTKKARITFSGNITGTITPLPPNRKKSKKKKKR